MKINGITRLGYFHHFLERNDNPGLRLFCFGMGWGKLSLGIDWTPFGNGTKRKGSGIDIWIRIPFMFFWFEWRRKEKP